MIEDRAVGPFGCDRRADPIAVERDDGVAAPGGERTMPATRGPTCRIRFPPSVSVDAPPTPMRCRGS
ncbi:hypothetical protein BRD17_05940 [Halobacteriales archaeon SW_7_68_16]|nr:MAG: hypothetical protein BRD17_05940 [Halobacteriales archaeon SW_7_68_16]